MIDELVEHFHRHFGRAPAIAAFAPGRVNWIGEHTDTTEGLVLPCAIDRATWVAAAPREDGLFRLVSREQPGPVEFRADALERRGDWADYARGVVASLGAARAGAARSGADLGIASQLPLGAGLSSSAALTVGIATALDAVFELGLSPRERALHGHRAEHDFVGVPCGRMDSLVSALGCEGQLLRIDCRSFETQPVPLPAELRLLVVQSGVTRRLAAGGYGQLRAECVEAFETARSAGIGAPWARSLRDLDAVSLPALEKALPNLLFRRARHVITENARVDASCTALRAGDLQAAGGLLREGMRSLRDDFRVSLPELDALCEIGDATPGVYGSRLTGAGFGGCTLHAVAADAADEAARAIASGFEQRFGRHPAHSTVQAGEGAARVAL